jgi:hypothetical protein
LGQISVPFYHAKTGAVEHDITTRRRDDVFKQARATPNSRHRLIRRKV